MAKISCSEDTLKPIVKSAIKRKTKVVIPLTGGNIMTDTPPQKNSYRKKIILAAASFIILVLLIFYFATRGKIKTDDAYIDGHIYSITPRIGGYITAVHVSDNQQVEKNVELLTLDATDFEVQLAQSKAGLAEAEATLMALELGVPLEVDQTTYRVRNAKAQMDSMRQILAKTQKDEEAAVQDLNRTRALYEQSVLDLKRIKGLSQTQVISQSALDNAETAMQSSKALMEASRARTESIAKQKASVLSDLEGLKANIDLAATGEDQARIKTSQVEAQKAKVSLAKAMVKQAELNLSYTRITSPVRGFVTKKGVETGQMVAKGQPLMAIVPLSMEDMWITANYKETQITDVKAGQEVIIRVDTYPDAKIKGKVDSIMAGTGATFSLFPPENATGNFVKVVQRIPVKIIFNEENQSSVPVLRIGMSVVPTIYTR